MSRNKKAWQLTALIALNLLMLILISCVCTLRADAVYLGSSGEKVAAIQRKLKKSGLYDGEINGNYDFATRKAIKIFQEQNKAEQSGEADYETILLLGLDSRSGKCFSFETELLARYLRQSDASNYPEMLQKGEEILEKAGAMPLGQYLFSFSDKKLRAPIFVGALSFYRRMYVCREDSPQGCGIRAVSKIGGRSLSHFPLRQL